MGDYTKKGVKIGTCGKGYYTTLEMLKKQANSNDDEINYYLNPKNKCSFAFPFPQYDGKQIGEISSFHDDVQCFVHLPSTIDSVHTKITTHLHPKGGQGINLFMACPYDKVNKSDHSSNLDKSFITMRISGQGYFNDSLRVLATCIYCNQGQYLDEHETDLAYESLMKQAEQEVKYSNTEKYLHPECSNWEHHLERSEWLKEVAKRLKQTILTEA